MNPYSRFGLFSSSVTAALILAGMVGGAPYIYSSLSVFGGGTAFEFGVATAGAVTLLAVFWMTFTEVIFPSLFKLDWVRQAILGKYYIEGTWLQAEKGSSESHIAVIDIQPNGKSFTFSGYALDENLDVNSNVLIELSEFNWPFLTYTYRNSLSDGADGQRDGVGEVQFEMNRSAARRYNGFSQFIKNDQRTRLEGSKLLKNADVKRLRTLEGREEIVDKYWELFFGREERIKAKQMQKRPPFAHIKTNAPAEPVAAPATTATPAPLDDNIAESLREEHDELVLRTPPMEEERRSGAQTRPEDLEESVIPRRRTSDWSDPLDEAAAETTEIDSEPTQPADTAESSDKAPKKAAIDKRHVM